LYVRLIVRLGETPLVKIAKKVMIIKNMNKIMFMQSSNL
jgi:hypothetical protein